MGPIEKKFYPIYTLNRSGICLTDDGCISKLPTGWNLKKTENELRIFDKYNNLRFRLTFQNNHIFKVHVEKIPEMVRIIEDYTETREVTTVFLPTTTKERDVGDIIIEKYQELGFKLPSDYKIGDIITAKLPHGWTAIEQSFWEDEEIFTGIFDNQGNLRVRIQRDKEYKKNGKITPLFFDGKERPKESKEIRKKLLENQALIKEILENLSFKWSNKTPYAVIYDKNWARRKLFYYINKIPDNLPNRQKFYFGFFASRKIAQKAVNLINNSQCKTCSYNHRDTVSVVKMNDDNKSIRGVLINGITFPKWEKFFLSKSRPFSLYPSIQFWECISN